MTYASTNPVHFVWADGDVEVIRRSHPHAFLGTKLDAPADEMKADDTDTLPDTPAVTKRAQAILDEADSWAEQLTAVWVRILRREKKVITAKLGGSKARENTKFWDWGAAGPPEGFEFKALNVGKWMDTSRWLDDLAEELTPVFDRLYASVLDKGDKLFAEEKAPPRPRARIARERRDLAKLTARRISEAREYHEAWLTRLGQLVDEIAARDVVVMQQVLDAVEVQYTEAEGEVSAVAQSQAIASVNDAQLEVVKRSGLKGKKVWFTAMDERVRPAHRKIHGQRRALDKPFKVPYRGKVAEGWKNVDMQYPGDRSAPPGLWINCRCVLLFYPATATGEPESGLEAAARFATLQSSLAFDITRHLEEKDIRRVRTTEGARRFHRPVGAPIYGPDATPEVLPQYHERDTRELVGRDAAQRSFDLRDAMRDWVYSFDSAKRIRMAAGELTDAYDDVLSPQLYDEPDNFFERESIAAYGPPPHDMTPTPAEEAEGLSWAYASAEIHARALLAALTKAPAHDGPLYRHVNVPLDTLPAFDDALRGGQVDLPLEAVGDSAWFVARFDRTAVPEHPDWQPEPLSDEDRYQFEGDLAEHGYRSLAAYEAEQRRQRQEPEFHVPVLFRILPGARALTGGDEYTGGRRQDWREYITGGRFEVVSDTVEKIPDQYPATHPMHSEPTAQRVVTLRQTHTYLPKGHRVMTASPATPATPATPDEKSLQLPGHGQGHEGLPVAQPGVAEKSIVASPLDLFGDLFDPRPTLVDGGLGVAPEEVLGEGPAVGLADLGVGPDFLVVALQDWARLLQFLGEDDTGFGHDPSLPPAPGPLPSAPDEKGLLSRILHVRSHEGEVRYDLPLNAPIVPHPDAPSGRRHGRARVTVTGAAREADAAAQPKEHRGITEGWGGKGRKAGEHFIVNGVMLPKRPTTGKWAEGEGRYNFRTGANFPEFFGEWDPKTYVDGIKDGAFDGYYPGYTPFWVNTDGKIMALTSHDQLPNMTLKQADSFGYVRVLVMSRNIDDNYTPLTNPMLSIEFVNDPNAKQREAIATVMAQLETSHALVSKKLNTQHFQDVIEATGGSVSVEALGKANGKSFLLDDAKVLDDFLSNPTDPPKGTPSAASIAAPVIRESIRSFLQHGDLYDPEAADPGRQYRSDEALDVARRQGAKATKGGVLDLLEKVAAVRHVRTPEGVSQYHEPIGSPIVPHPGAPVATVVDALAHVTHNAARTPPDPAPPREVSFDADRLEAFQAEVDRLNKIAARLKVAPITFTEVSRGTRKADDWQNLYADPSDAKVETVTLAVSGDSPRLPGGWTYIGTIEDLRGGPGEKDGRLVHGDDPRLAAFRHVPMHCEYCNKARDRRKVMVLQGDDGKLTRVGSSCLKDFLGYHGNPERVTAYADKVRGSLFADDDEQGWARRVPTDIPTDTFLDLTAAVVREFGWVPKSSHYGIPTAQRVQDILHGPSAGAGRDYKDELARVKITDEDRNRARVVREWASQQDYADNYLGNLRTILGGPSVGTNRYGLAASAIGAYERSIGIEAEKRRKREAAQAARANSTWVGTPGKRESFTATVTAKIPYESAYGTGYVIKLTDDEGNVMKTFTSGNWVYQTNVGDKVTFKATVKAHDTYQDTKETNLTRVGQVDWHKDEEAKALDRLGIEWAVEWGLEDEVT